MESRGEESTVNEEARTGKNVLVERRRDLAARDQCIEFVGLVSRVQIAIGEPGSRGGVGFEGGLLTQDPPACKEEEGEDGNRVQEKVSVSKDVHQAK